MASTCILKITTLLLFLFMIKKVLASGQFKRPMYYQLKQGEGLEALLGFTGGFTSDAYATGGMIIRNVNEKPQLCHLDQPGYCICYGHFC